MTRHFARRSRGLLFAAVLAGCGGADETGGTAPKLPAAPVEILVDGLGVPHIYAESDLDLFYGYGYQLASDRMLQLEMFRRFAHGRLSEALGPDGAGSGGETTLADDRLARLFDWSHYGRLDAAWMREHEPEDHALTGAWVAGINARVAEVRSGAAPLPYGFAALEMLPGPWEPEDPYVVQKMAAFGLDQSILFEIFLTFARSFAPDAIGAVEPFRPARAAYVLPPEDRPPAVRSGDGGALGGSPMASAAPKPSSPDPARLSRALDALGRLARIKPLGSNNWAVDGRHTASGTPLLAGDPHLGYDFSGVTYAVHLESAHAGGSFAVAGFAFVGAPGIFAGHNDAVAFTPTSAFADVMDVWGVRVEDGRAHVGDAVVPVVTREEVIQVRGGDPDVVVAMDVPGYGVILPSDAVGSPIPLAGEGREALVGWRGFAARPARYFRALARVRTLDELDAAVLRMPEMTYNFLGASAEGIRYRVGVDVPRRGPIAAGREPYVVMNGDDPVAFWTGEVLSPDELPHSRAEARGWIASANNDPFGFTDDGRVDDDPFYYAALFASGWRAGRIEAELARLAARGGVTREDMQALAMDVHDNLADDLLGPLAEAWAAAGSDAALAAYKDRADLARLVTLLTKEWDAEVRRDSPGALAFHAFAHFVAVQALEDDLPLLFERALEAAPVFVLKIASMAAAGRYAKGDGVLQQGKSRMLLEALDATAALLTERFGGVEPARYRLSDVRVTSLAGAYGRGTDPGLVATDGGEATVNVAQSTFRKDGKVLDKWLSHWGPMERSVWSFAADGTPEAWVNFALGNVADPESPHFDDALAGWVEGSYEKLPFARAEVEAATERRIELAAAR
jgi:penicillin amidase